MLETAPQNATPPIQAQHRHVPLERLGTHHNAAADAESQARHLIKMLCKEIVAEAAS